MGNINPLEEELFCQKFELEALANITLRNESERWIPGYINGITEDSHLKRYQLACNYSKGRNVLDLACGAGRGSLMLAIEGEAQAVVSGDIGLDTIRYAQHRNKHDKITYKIMDAENFSNQEPLDLVVSYETIEHLKNYEQFLRNVKSSLKDDGLFLVSTPISSIPFDASPINPYHVQEWGFVEFQKLLNSFFSIQKVYLQLYQNVFLKEEFETKTKNSALKRTILYNIYKNIFLKKYNKLENKPDFSNWNNLTNYSKIVEYTGQFDLEKLGKTYIGYQIILAKRK